MLARSRRCYALHAAVNARPGNRNVVNRAFVTQQNPRKVVADWRTLCCTASGRVLVIQRYDRRAVEDAGEGVRFVRKGSDRRETSGKTGSGVSRTL